MKALTARQLIQHLELGLKTLGVDDAQVVFWSGVTNEASNIYPEHMTPDEFWTVEGFYKPEPTDPQDFPSIHLTDRDH